MKKLRLTAICALVLTFVVGLSASAQAAPGLEVVPTEHNFGDVQLGSSSSTIITITNNELEPYFIDTVGLASGGSADFSILSAPALGTELLPGVADWRLNRFRNMIVIAGVFIDNGWIELACWQLERTDKRCDGMSWPPDLVEGEDTPELNAMILALMADLGC
jgi:hypothetical protein